MLLGCSESLMCYSVVAGVFWVVARVFWVFNVLLCGCCDVLGGCWGVVRVF